MTTISDFLGSYTVNSGSGYFSTIRPDQQVKITESTNGNEVEVLVTDPLGNPVFPSTGQPANFTFDSKTCSLIYTGPAPGSQQQLSIQMSLYQRPELGSGQPFKAIYAVALGGDPQQVGTWGADDQP